MPAALIAFGMAMEGVVVNHIGSCAASAKPRIFAIGFIPSSCAFSLLINTTAAAPSLMVEAFAAVTVPSFVKTGFNPGIFSKFTFLNSSSSAKNVTSPFFPAISTGIISSLNFPAAQAAADRL